MAIGYTWDSTKKAVVDASDTQMHLVIHFDGNEYPDLIDEVYYESLEIDESLIDQENLQFGKCNGTTLKVRVKASAMQIDGLSIYAYWQVQNTRLNSNFQLPIGHFIIKSSKRTADKMYRDIIATDYMSKFDIDVTDWYNQEFPTDDTTVILVECLRSLCEYCGVPFVYEDFPKQYTPLYKEITPKTLKGRDVLEDMFERIGCFGHCTYLGTVKPIFISKSALYPSDDLYPETIGLYPRGEDREGGNLANNISYYTSSEYEDYQVASINSVAITDLQGNVIAYYDGPEVTEHNQKVNRYTVQCNMFLVGETAAQAHGYAMELYEAYKHFEYTPQKTTVVGGLYYELGTQVTLHGVADTFDSYVLKRHISGIVAPKTTIESTGRQYISEVDKDITTQVEMLSASSQIMAEEIDNKVTKNTVSVELSNETGTVSITGNRLIVDSDNFKLTSGGDVTTLGDITFKNALKAKHTENGNLWEVIKAVPSDNPQYPNDSDVVISSATDGSIDQHIFLTRDGATIDYAEFELGAHCYRDFSVSQNLTVYGDFDVAGQKHRLVHTPHYGDRLLSAYETPCPMFGDTGHGKIGKDGKCYIYHDVVFLETINTKQDYQVFLQSYSENPVWISGKTEEYFVVSGTPDCEFDWEMKAKQRDYEIARLEESIPIAKEIEDE